MRAAVTLLLLAACSAPPPPPAVVPYGLIETSSGHVATATHLGNGIWVTCRHVLDAEPRGTLCYLPVEFEVLSQGESLDLLVDDWTIFTTHPSVEIARTPACFTVRPEPGEWVWIAGREQNGQCVLFPTRVLRSYEPGVLALETDGVPLHGISGAPVIWRGLVIALVAGQITYDGSLTVRVAVQPKGL